MRNKTTYVSGGQRRLPGVPSQERLLSFGDLNLKIVGLLIFCQQKVKVKVDFPVLIRLSSFVEISKNVLLGTDRTLKCLEAIITVFYIKGDSLINKL